MNRRHSSGLGFLIAVLLVWFIQTRDYSLSPSDGHATATAIFSIATAEYDTAQTIKDAIEDAGIVQAVYDTHIHDYARGGGQLFASVIAEVAVDVDVSVTMIAVRDVVLGVAPSADAVQVILVIGGRDGERINWDWIAVLDQWITPHWIDVGLATEDASR